MIQVLYDASCAECLRAIQLVSYREETLRTFARVSLVFVVLLGFLQGWPVKRQLFSSMPGRRERESCKACNLSYKEARFFAVSVLVALDVAKRKPQCPCSQWQGLSSSKRPTSLSRKVGAWELDFWVVCNFLSILDCSAHAKLEMRASHKDSLQGSHLCNGTHRNFDLVFGNGHVQSFVF